MSEIFLVLHPAPYSLCIRFARRLNQLHNLLEARCGLTVPVDKDFRQVECVKRLHWESAVLASRMETTDARTGDGYN